MTPELVSSKNVFEGNISHAVLNPFKGAGASQSLVAETRHPHHVCHRQRRQYVHEHQRAQLTELHVQHSNRACSHLLQTEVCT